MAPASDVQLFSRYECKYYVPEWMLAPMRDHIGPFVRPDKHAASRPGYRYPVCSLYLDSPGLELYAMAAKGLRSRFKLRVRHYEGGDGEPVFCEIKRRQDDVILKRRVATTAEEARNFLKKTLNHEIHGQDAWPTQAAEFMNLTNLTLARPMLYVRYQREAYESATGDPVRITFDSQLEESIAGHDPLSGQQDWNPLSVEGVILEIKFTDRFPLWVRGMIDRFQLQRRSVPKYLMSVESVLRRGGYRPPVQSEMDTLVALRMASGRA
ncbi:MAG: polyphosphate polymerase domain-containing protein [Deltaproteobacteria bacterium]